MAVEKLPEIINVYNFEIEDLHTYYVADGVLVHNGCGEIDTATDEETDLYHYTDEKGAKAIQESGMIKTDDRGRIFVTTDQISPQDANNALFMGMKGNDCASYRVEIILIDQNDINLTTKGATQPNELIYLGTLKNGKNAILVVKENDF